MGDTRTAEEAKQWNIRKMGKQAGEIYSALWQDIAGMFLVFEEFQNLYANEETRVDVLNDAAPAFFGMIQELLWHELMLGVARVTDTVGSGNRQNLTVQRLPALIAGRSNQAVQAAANKACEAADFCRQWRNKRIAHRDLSHAVDAKVAWLPAATLGRMREALQALEAALNAASRALDGSQSHFDGAGVKGGAARLLRILDLGLAAAHARRTSRRTAAGHANST